MAYIKNLIKEVYISNCMAMLVLVMVLTGCGATTESDITIIGGADQSGNSL